MIEKTTVLEAPKCPLEAIQRRVNCAVDELISSLPEIESLSAIQRRGIIARYTAALEGNFIYWMTATFLTLKSAIAQNIIRDNLLDEVRGCHPGMLRRFAVAAHAVPTDADFLAISAEVSDIRLFMGRLSTLPTVTGMAFFEGFIQKFMSYLADLAQCQGSSEQEYTDVHCVCDIGHTEGLFKAIDAEIADNPPDSATNVFEGVDLLCALIRGIVQGVHTSAKRG